MIIMVSNGKLKKLFSCLWQNLTFDALSDSFDYVLTLGAFSKFCTKSPILVTCLVAPKSMYYFSSLLFMLIETIATSNSFIMGMSCSSFFPCSP